MRRGRGERKARVRMEVGENRERLKKLKGIGRRLRKVGAGRPHLMSSSIRPYRLPLHIKIKR